MNEKKETVLFLCRHNSCRSQMAEAILREMAGDRFKVVSAGVHPRPIHPLVDVVLREIGLDSSEQTSKSMDLYLGHTILEHIIIVCEALERDCPRLEPFALHVERWPLPDPSEFVGNREEQLNAFRATRDDLRERLGEWLAALPEEDG